jgi:predicted acyl esterase
MSELVIQYPKLMLTLVYKYRRTVAALSAAGLVWAYYRLPLAILRLMASAMQLRMHGDPAKRESPLYELLEHEYLVRMPDGVNLKTYHIEPTHSKTAKAKQLCLPVIMMRSPYSGTMAGVFANCFAQRGYHVIQQDCRGRFGSEGTFEILECEKDDARATLKWLGQQSWCNGSVGSWGVSYDGYTAWTGLAASMEGDHGDSDADTAADADSKPAAVVRAAVPIFTSTDLGKAGIFRGGAFALEMALRYVHLTHVLSTPGKLLGNTGAWVVTTILTVWDTKYQKGPHFDKALRSLPVIDVDQALLGCKPMPFPVGCEDPHHPYWEKRDQSMVTRKLSALASSSNSVDGSSLAISNPAVPAVHLIAGWFDIFADAQLADFESMTRSTEHSTAAAGDGAAAAGDAAAPSPNFMLTVGPWHHFAPQNLSVRESLKFFDEHLKGFRREGGAGTRPESMHNPKPRKAVRLWMLGAETDVIFNAGAAYASELHSLPIVERLRVSWDALTNPTSLHNNQSDHAQAWRDYERWPPTESKTVPLFLLGNDGSTDHHNDGGLLRLDRATKTGDNFGGIHRYAYDPEGDPTPAVGGRLFHPQKLGVETQNSLEQRADVLLYTSAPVTTGVEIVGRVGVRLWVSSSADSADFFARLCDVSASGKSVNLCDGITRLRDWENKSGLMTAHADWEMDGKDDDDDDDDEEEEVEEVEGEEEEVEGEEVEGEEEEVQALEKGQARTSPKGACSASSASSASSVRSLFKQKKRREQTNEQGSPAPSQRSIHQPRKVGRRRTSLNRTDGPGGDGVPTARKRRHSLQQDFTSLATPQLIEVNMGGVCALIKPGHRIRLQVSSGAFPRYDRNLGTNAPFLRGTRMVVAEQRVYWGSPEQQGQLLSTSAEWGSPASQLLLPIIGGHTSANESGLLVSA